MSNETPENKAEPIILEVHGRTFDVSTPEGAAQHKIWAEALSSTTGALGAKVGELTKKIAELEQEVQPLRTYNLKSASVDEAQIAAKVSELQAQGDHEAATKLLFEFNRQVRKDLEAERERDRLFSDYAKANPDVFRVVSEDVLRDYVFRNHAEALASSEDPFSTLDKIVKSKVVRSEQRAQPAATLGASQVAPAKIEPETKKVDETETWDKLTTELGFK